MKKTDFHTQIYDERNELAAAIDGLPASNYVCAIQHRIRELDDNLIPNQAVTSLRLRRGPSVAAITRGAYGHAISFDVVGLAEFYRRWFPGVNQLPWPMGKYVAIVESRVKCLIPI